MKKYFITAAMMAAVVAFTACSDDNELNQNTQTQVKTEKTDASLTGTYTTVYADPETGTELNLILNGDNVTMYSSNKGVMQETSTAKGMYDSNTGFTKADLASEVCGVKSIAIKKVGTSYIDCDATMTDGSVKNFGFVSSTQLVTRVASTGDATIDFVYNVSIEGMKQGLKMLIEATPLKPLSGTIMGLIPDLSIHEEEVPDMKVTDCFNKLNTSMKAFDSKLDDVKDDIKKLHDYDQLGQHDDEYFFLRNHNIKYTSKIASIADSLAVATSTEQTERLTKQFNQAVSDWGNMNVNGSQGYNAALHFLHKLAQGTTEGKRWIDVFDSCAERIYPWEHMGYDAREIFRARDYNLAIESVALLAAYDNIENANVGCGERDFDVIKSIYESKANAVVRDSDNVICQIPGANHVKIGRGTFGVENEYSLIEFAHEKHAAAAYGIPAEGMIQSKNMDWFVIPSAKLHYISEIPEDKYYVQQEAEKMITLDEIKTILKYYNGGNVGGKYSVRDIFKMIGLNVFDKSICQHNESIFPCWGVKSKIDSNSESKYFSVKTDEMVYLDRKSKPIDSFCYGTYEQTVNWHHISRLVATNNPKLTDVTINTVRVRGRENGWKPGQQK